MPNPDLERFTRELDDARRDAAALTGDLSEARARWRPRPERWSAVQVVDHLRATNALYADAIARSIDAARAGGRVGAQAYRPGWIGGWMVRSMEPPVRRRFKSPRIFAPTDDALPDWTAALAGYRATHDALAERIRAADGVKLNAARVVSPGSKLLRISLGDALALVLAHERRHLWQLRQLRSDSAFPAS